MTANKTAHDIAIEINTVLAKDLQANLRCAICCSTLKNPVVPSCNHPFCKDCIDLCFNKKTQIECPICRQQIKRRSCIPSESLNSLVQAYLQLARAFKRDVAEAAINIPKENVFLESQAILSTQTDSPMRDFLPPKGLPPTFAKPRPKRKNLAAPPQPAKLSKLVEEIEPEEIKDCAIPESNGLKRSAQGNVKSLPEKKVAKKEIDTSKGVNVEVQCEFEADLSKINIRTVIDQKRKTDASIHSDIEALFSILPGIVSILMKDEEQEALCRIINMRSIRDVSSSQWISREKGSADHIDKSLANRGLKNLSTPLAKDVNKTIESYNELDSANFFSEISSKDTVKVNTISTSGLSDSGSFELGEPQDLGAPLPLTKLTDSRETPKRADSFIATRKFADFGIDTSSTIEPHEIVPGTPSSVTPIKHADDNKENEFNDSFEAEVTLRLTDSLRTPSSVSSKPGFEFNSTKRRQSYVLSMSRIENQTDEDLVHEFRIAFPMIKINDDVCDNVTHLVVMNTNGKCHRSLKYAFAIVRNCELLGRQWLEDCVKQGRLLPTAPYTPRVSTQSQLTASHRVRTSKIPLFTNKKFMLPPRFSNHHVITREKLGELIELCGGKLITKLWECDPQDTYIIFATESKEYDVARRYEFDTKVPVLNAEWILDSVAEFRTITPFDKYRVFSTTANQAVKY
ncbi:unnamed protein product [Auanema sp. JU1783]|nr:unnamed protein product [Auanema sp. JU1783]